MSVIQNLIEARFIKPGTWIGVNTNSRTILQRYVVDELRNNGEIVATDVQTMNKIRLRGEVIAEIDGMRLDRFLQQADLNNDGLKITGIKRRGRKPRNRQ